MAVKYIFVTGGVVSGLGKGITAASLGRLLKARGKKVTIQKFDPYINIDPAMMSPLQHGEVFVTEDGAETDLDLGHYERFIDENLGLRNDITTGTIYWSVISKERRGEYGGGTVQVIPHITNEIKECIYQVARDNDTDIVITEIGGTVGDIESLPYLEAIRQVSVDVGRENCMYVHVTLVPYIGQSGEMKSKPTQHSVKELLSIGIQPDVVVCRADNSLTQDFKDKLALFCNIRPECVIQNASASILYEVPLLLEKEGLADVVCRRLSLDNTVPDLKEWSAMVEKAKNLSGTVKIALVGKYVSLYDAYISIVEALRHAGIANGVNIEVDWVDCNTLTESNVAEKLASADGILVPDGFGDTEVSGKIHAIRYARENNVPYFGICLGMQMAAIEFARNVAGIADADSEGFNPTTANPVVYSAGRASDNPGRRGKYPCKLTAGSKCVDIYGEELISERHRHHFEFNPAYTETFAKAGMTVGGISPEGDLVEILEIKDHKWFVGVQFNPEYKSRPNRPHPLFDSFIKACKG